MTKQFIYEAHEKKVLNSIFLTIFDLNNMENDGE